MPSPTVVSQQAQMAAELVRSLGGEASTPATLSSDNHLTLRFGDLVAKVRRAQPGSSGALNMAREVGVAKHLTAVGAPAASPSLDPPPGPHFLGDLAITLWRNVDGRPLTEAHAKDAAWALRRVQAGLASYPGALPELSAAFDGCVDILRDPASSPRLIATDRAFLLAEHQRLRSAFDRLKYRPAALHGDARLANALMTSRGVVWLDFEAACLGPIERDLTQFPENALAGFRPIDRSMLRLMRAYGAACVAVWCWADPDPTPTVAEAADFHLAQLKLRAARG